MTQTGGLVILYAWLIFAGLLAVLAYLLLRHEQDPLQDLARPSPDQDDSRDDRDPSKSGSKSLPARLRRPPRRPIRAEGGTRCGPVSCPAAYRISLRTTSPPSSGLAVSPLGKGRRRSLCAAAGPGPLPDLCMRTTQWWYHWCGPPGQRTGPWARSGAARRPARSAALRRGTPFSPSSCQFTPRRTGRPDSISRRAVREPGDPVPG
jgi:hypothetical protein